MPVLCCCHMTSTHLHKYTSGNVHCLSCLPSCQPHEFRGIIGGLLSNYWYIRYAAGGSWYIFFWTHLHLQQDNDVLEVPFMRKWSACGDVGTSCTVPSGHRCLPDTCAPAQIADEADHGDRTTATPCQRTVSCMEISKVHFTALTHNSTSCLPVIISAKRIRATPQSRL